MQTTITVNGEVRALDVDPRTTLLDALRETLALTGSKKGCDHGQCGACTVLVNGVRINSCLTLAVMHDGDAVTTIEGVGGADDLHPLQRAFLTEDAFQCGYCTPGQICSALGMLAEVAENQPSQETADLIGKIAFTDDELRERLALTGTKKGCDRGQCGACTVLVDGRRINARLALALSLDGAEVETIEGLADGDRLHPVQAAFIEHDGFQCGYCTPGQIMSAVALLAEGKAKTDAEVRELMSGNLCRCGAYPNIIAAIQSARQKGA